jgi:hypothetical protein
MEKRLLHLLVGILFFLALFGLVAAPVHAKPSNKWRIEVSEGANADGEIVFRIEPVGGETIEALCANESETPHP